MVLKKNNGMKKSRQHGTKILGPGPKISNSLLKYAEIYCGEMFRLHNDCVVCCYIRVVLSSVVIAISKQPVDYLYSYLRCSYFSVYFYEM